MQDSEQVPRQLTAIYDLLEITDPNKIEKGHVEKIVAWLYRILDTIDSKTSHLLRLNSLILAAMAFLLQEILKNPSAPSWQKVSSAIALLLPLVTIFVAMLVFKVEWPFLHWRKEHVHLTPEQVQQEMQREFTALAMKCDCRVDQHLLVWKLTLGSIIVAALSILGSVSYRY